jgi:hypothetical protein
MLKIKTYKPPSLAFSRWSASISKGQGGDAEIDMFMKL